MGVAELVLVFGQVLTERLDVPGATRPVSHRIDLERDLVESERGDEREGQGDDFDIQVGVGGPDRLQAELEMLAVTPLLGVLVAEGRGPVPRLPGGHRVVLHKGTHDGCRPLRAQSQDLTVAVDEGVHLLADDLAALADPPVKDADVLEDRRDSQAVAGPLDQPGETVDQALPPIRLRPQHVVHALGCPGRVRARARTSGRRLAHAQTFLPGS